MKKITIIYDNRIDNELMQAGWGFSCLVDLGERKILFDTGANQAAFFSNLQKLGVCCSEISDVLFSHEHSDHIAGFEEVLAQMREGTRLFLPKKFPSKKIPAPIRSETVDDFKEIGPGAYSLVLKAGFSLYEQALLLKTPKGLVIITGCAHPGIVELVEAAKKRLGGPVHLVLGGFHLFRKSRRAVGCIIDSFQTLQVGRAAPCHCSGDEAIEQFKEAYQERFCKIGTGTTIDLD